MQNIQFPSNQSQASLSSLSLKEGGEQQSVEHNRQSLDVEKKISASEGLGGGQQDKISVDHSVNGLKDILSDVNKLLKTNNSQLHFDLDVSSHQMVMKITDQKTGDVIRSIPSKEALEISKRITDYLQHIHQSMALGDKGDAAKGLIVESRA